MELRLRLVLLQDVRMSGGVPGPLGYVAGQSGLCIDESFLDVCCQVLLSE